MFKALLFTTSLLLSCAAMADELPRREISVQGQATQLVSPDKVRLSITVEGRSKDLDQAMNQAGERSQEAIAAIQDLLEKSKIRALQTQVREVVRGTTRSWRRDSGEAMEILASRQIQLQAMDIAKLPELMRRLSQQALARIDQVTPFVSDAAAIEDALMLLAVEDARKRAMRIAKQLDVRLGLPIAVNVQSAHMPRPHREMRMMASQADAGGGYDSVGENEIRAAVAIRFELEAD